jgi:hypothetical protein
MGFGAGLGAAFTAGFLAAGAATVFFAGWAAAFGATDFGAALAAGLAAVFTGVLTATVALGLITFLAVATLLAAGVAEAAEVFWAVLALTGTALAGGVAVRVAGFLAGDFKARLLWVPIGWVSVEGA